MLYYMNPSTDSLVRDAGTFMQSSGAITASTFVVLSRIIGSRARLHWFIYFTFLALLVVAQRTQYLVLYNVEIPEDFRRVFDQLVFSFGFLLPNVLIEKIDTNSLSVPSDSYHTFYRDNIDVVEARLTVL